MLQQSWRIFEIQFRVYLCLSLTRRTERLKVWTESKSSILHIASDWNVVEQVEGAITGSFHFFVMNSRNQHVVDVLNLQMSFNWTFIRGNERVASYGRYVPISPSEHLVTQKNL